MTIVDGHLHVGLAKYRPVEDLLKVMEQHGVARAVLVQFIGNIDNTYLSECLRRFPGRFAAIGIVDTAQPDAIDRLRMWVRERGISGLRLPATTRSPGADPDAIWAAMEELGIVASITATSLTSNDGLATMTSPAFEDLVRRFPRLKFRLEHLGWYPNVAEPPPYAEYRRFLRLADYPNTYTTWSSFYDFSREPYPYRDVLPFLKMTYQAFGARRIMWGSDWPLIEQHEGYARALAFALNELPVDSEEDRAWILGKTAESLYRFDIVPSAPAAVP
jgi:L-fuconolactonase